MLKLFPCYAKDDRTCTAGRTKIFHSHILDIVVGHTDICLEGKHTGGVFVPTNNGVSKMYEHKRS